jgi:hypothetical protein
VHKTWLGAAKSLLSLAHRTVRWCTGQCPVRPAELRWTGHSRGSLVMYDYNSSDCPVSQWSAAQSSRDAWPAPTVGWGHRIVRCAPDCVRCANRSWGTTVRCARIGRRSCTGQLQWLSGGAPDCPVRHPTEDNLGLPCWSPMAPSCLGAIKGTPRRMEESPQAFTKHSKSPTLRLRALDRLC